MSQEARDTRDATYAILSSGDYPLSPPARSVLWFWESAMWTDPMSPWFGHVDIRFTGTAKVMTATGFSKSTVRRAVAQLAAQGFIQRNERYVGGQRINDDIILATPRDWNWCCGHRGSHRPDCMGNHQLGVVTVTTA